MFMLQDKDFISQKLHVSFSNQITYSGKHSWSHDKWESESLLWLVSISVWSGLRENEVEWTGKVGIGKADIPISISKLERGNLDKNDSSGFSKGEALICEFLRERINLSHRPEQTLEIRGCNLLLAFVGDV